MRTLACDLEPFWLEVILNATGYAALKKTHNDVLHSYYVTITAVAPLSDKYLLHSHPLVSNLLKRTIKAC